MKGRRTSILYNPKATKYHWKIQQRGRKTQIGLTDDQAEFILNPAIFQRYHGKGKKVRLVVLEEAIEVDMEEP